ncbi:unnamed protein product [Lactuca virosa]|uniref:Transposase-associated domain-containing protein n=1 Tax=Lactuca virosa TaxID=75947 RepID=A0AAU9NCE7_9ASTR|nr:unnamed protein product [Lactuca virosa]
MSLIATPPKTQFPAPLIVQLIDQTYPNKTIPYTGDFRPLLQYTSADDSRLIPTSATISGLPSNHRCRTPPPTLPRTTTVTAPYHHRRCPTPPSATPQIEMTSNGEWMYTKILTRNGAFNTEFRHYVNHFLDFTYTNATNIQHNIMEGVEVFEIRCMCKKCKNRYYKTRNLVELHLCQKGFIEDYMFWYAHGELYPTQENGQCSNPETSQDNDEGVGDYHRYEQMIIESMHQPEAPYSQQAPYFQQVQQNPNQSAQTFYKMLNQVSEPL